MPNHILISGPVSWNSIVYLDHLPEPRPHMQFALEDFETVGGTSAGKALHLAGLGRKVTCQTVMVTMRPLPGCARCSNRPKLSCTWPPFRALVNGI